MKHNTLPTLTNTQTPADALGFFEAVALAGLENTPIHISHAVQRKHFGKVLFGKKTVTVNELGQIRVTYSTGYSKESYDEHFVAYSALTNSVESVSYINHSKFSNSVF